MILGACRSNPNFIDSAGKSCKDYIVNKWCNSTGGYGEGWIKRDGGNNKFEDYTKKQEDARVCPQCGCYTGNRN